MPTDWIVNRLDHATEPEGEALEDKFRLHPRVDSDLETILRANPASAQAQILNPAPKRRPDSDQKIFADASPPQCRACAAARDGSHFDTFPAGG